MEYLFSEDEVKDAYLKLKNMIYYDKSYLFNRDKLAAFEFKNKVCESSTEDIFKKLTNKINYICNDEVFLNKYLSKLSAHILPKKIHTQREYEQKNIKDTFASQTFQMISNRSCSTKYIVDDVNYYIDIPIELQILDVLWIVKCGYVLENSLCDYLGKNRSCYSYANKLCLDSEGKVATGRKLFKHYYNQYPKWRDSAIKEVENLYSSGKNSVIFSLDITKYYYNININYEVLFKEIEEKLQSNFDKNCEILNRILRDIHNKYRNYLYKKYGMNFIEKDVNYLPIGLLSSNIIANWYLEAFDKLVINKLKPNYYGRYVDDLLFVFEDNYVCTENICSNNFCPVENELNDCSLIEYFLSAVLIKESPETVCWEQGNDSQLSLKKYPDLKIQTNKIKIFLIDALAPNVVLEQFKTNIATTTSQFQFLPDDAEVDEEYIKKTFFVHYTDSVNKLRSVEKYTIDKFSTSVLLAKKIQIAKYLKSTISNDKVKKLINNYFYGKYCIILNSLWHKLFAYLVILDKPFLKDEISKFYCYAQKNINKIEFFSKGTSIKSDKIAEKLKSDLNKVLDISLSLAVSLNPSGFNDLLKNQDKNLNKILTRSTYFRYSNMFFHDYISVDGFNYTTSYYNDIVSKSKSGNINLVSFDKILKTEDNISFEINNLLVELSPLNLKLETENLLNFYSLLKNPSHSEDINKNIYNFVKRLFPKNNSFAGKCGVEVKKFSCQKDSSTVENLCESGNGELFDNSNPKDNNEDSRYNLFRFSDKGYNHKLRLGVCNIHIAEKDLLSAIEGHPNLSEYKYSQIREIITQAQKNNVELLIFPELSVPIEWLSLLQYHLKNNNMGIIFGLEHIIVHGKNERYCGNFLITMLPIVSEDENEPRFMFMKPRLKYYYSPNELKTLQDNRLTVLQKVSTSPAIYDIFNWHGLYFSPYNCYEIACIEDRAIVKSKVDFLTISEWNKDTNYFDNIVRSASRDLHCYIIQSNTSKYGHSCIIAPKKTEESNPVFIKGGVNATLLVEEIDFDRLRRFQRTLGFESKEFKDVPPCFNRNDVRLKNA